MASNPAPSSVGILSTPIYFIGGYDRNSPERNIVLERIKQLYNDLRCYNEITFNLPVTNGIPLEVAEFCRNNNIVYNSYNAFGRFQEFYSKTPSVIDDLVYMNKMASQNFWPNGSYSKYGPNKIIKCDKAIINDSNMVVIIHHKLVYAQWIPYLADKKHLFIDVEKFGSCNP